MSREILLVEDRISRMEQFINFDLSTNDAIDLKRETELVGLLKQINQNDISQLLNYKCLIFHSSSLSNIHKSNLKSFCKENNKNLVFFSGGITSSFYQDSDFPFLNINSKVLYKDNLKYFIDNFDPHNVNLLMLQYNDKWDLNILLNTRNKLVKFKEESNKILVNDLITNEYLKNILDLSFLNDNYYQLTEDNLQEISEKLNLLIFKKINK